jgi:hypothetical protein
MKIEHVLNKQNEHFIKLKFGEALEIVRFEQQLQDCINRCSPSNELAAYIIAQLLRKRNLFFSFPKAGTSITLDQWQAKALFEITATTTEYDLTFIRNTIHQKLIV